MDTSTEVLTAESFGTTEAEVGMMTSSSDEMLFDGDYVTKEDDEVVNLSLFETDENGIFLLDETIEDDFAEAYCDNYVVG